MRDFGRRLLQSVSAPTFKSPRHILRLYKCKDKGSESFQFFVFFQCHSSPKTTTLLTSHQLLAMHSSSQQLYISYSKIITPTALAAVSPLRRYLGKPPYLCDYCSDATQIFLFKYRPFRSGWQHALQREQDYNSWWREREKKKSSVERRARVAWECPRIIAGVENDL